MFHASTLSLIARRRPLLFATALGGIAYLQCFSAIPSASAQWITGDYVRETSYYSQEYLTPSDASGAASHTSGPPMQYAYISQNNAYAFSSGRWHREFRTGPNGGTPYVYVSYRGEVVGTYGFNPPSSNASFSSNVPSLSQAGPPDYDSVVARSLQCGPSGGTFFMQLNSDAFAYGHASAEGTLTLVITNGPPSFYGSIQPARPSGFRCQRFPYNFQTRLRYLAANQP